MSPAVRRLNVWDSPRVTILSQRLPAVKLFPNGWRGHSPRRGRVMNLAAQRRFLCCHCRPPKPHCLLGLRAAALVVSGSEPLPCERRFACGLLPSGKLWKT